MNNRIPVIALIAMSIDPIAIAAQESLAINSPAELSCLEKATLWLASTQAKTGGWGNVSLTEAIDDGEAAVITDPAITVFAATALLEAGGPLHTNPYRVNILHALHYLLLVIEAQSAVNKKKQRTARLLENKLGMHIDATRALNFLIAMREQLSHERDILRLNAAITICSELLENREAHAQSGERIINSLRLLETAGMERLGFTSESQSPTEGNRSTETTLREAGVIAIHEILTLGIDVLAEGFEQKGRKQKGKLADTAFKANEEFLSYTFYSESLESLDYDSWIKWRDELEYELSSTQHANGSWGETSGVNLVFSTAAALLALHGNPYSAESTAGK